MYTPLGLSFFYFGIHKRTLKYCHSCVPPSQSFLLYEAMSAIRPINICIRHGRVSYDISVLQDQTISVLQSCIESITAIPPDRQKLLYKGWKATHTPETTIQDAGLTNGIEVTMLGPTDQQLDTVAKVESEHQHRERVMRERELKGTVKVCPL